MVNLSSLGYLKNKGEIELDLILWRHAHAEALAKKGQLDTERQLTEKGLQQAAKMALWLERVLPDNCKILVSPSERTLQTAHALGRPFEIASEVGQDSTVDQILAACNWPNSRKPVLVIGHQPLLGQVVSKLIPTIQSASIRKGNVWWISQTDDGEHSATFLKAVMAPELVTK